MIQPYFERFEVNIIDKSFLTEDGLQYPMTAILTFYDKKGRVLFAKDYGHMHVAEIYEKIEKSEVLNLNHCYVQNFSFTAYRRICLMNKKDIVNLQHLSAKDAFFHSDYQIDFTHLSINNSNIDFSGCCFVGKELLFSNTRFGNGGVDFSYSLFRNSVVDFSNSIFGKGMVSFKNAIFIDGDKNFQYTDFGEGELMFINTEFGNGNIAFVNSNFNSGNVSFKVARFGDGHIDFHYAKFGAGDVSFERADFGNGNVDFRAVELGAGKVNFNRAVFGSGDISFEGTTAKGRITFRKTIFGEGNLNFEIAEFDNSELNMEKADIDSCSLTFREGKFKKIILKGCHIDNYLDLRVKKCDYIDLSDTVVRDIIDFKPYDKYIVNIGILNLTAMRLLGTIYIDWENNNVYNIITKQLDTTFFEKAEQFRILKQSFNKSGQYDDEDIAYVWFKRYELTAKYRRAKESSSLKGIPQWFEYQFKKLVFDHVGLYATDPVRVLVSMFITFIIFGLTYAIVLQTGLGGIESGLGGFHSHFSIIGRSLYHSGITFLTIGYGDFYPMGAVRWLSNIEGFVGVFLMSYFTVAFVRKILR